MVRATLALNGLGAGVAKRLECGQLAAAFGESSAPESGSKLAALQTLRHIQTPTGGTSIVERLPADFGPWTLGFGLSRQPPPQRMPQEDFQQHQSQAGRDDPGEQFAVLGILFHLFFGLLQLVNLAVDGLELLGIVSPIIFAAGRSAIVWRVSSSMSTGIIRYMVSPVKGFRPAGMGASPRMPTPMV